MARRTGIGQPSPALGVLGRIVRNPRFELAMGVLVFLIGLAEVIEDVFAMVLPGPEAHHGLLLLGTVIALRGLVDVIEGAEQVVQASVADDVGAHDVDTRSEPHP